MSDLKCIAVYRILHGRLKIFQNADSQTDTVTGLDPFKSVISQHSYTDSHEWLNFTCESFKHEIRKSLTYYTQRHKENYNNNPAEESTFWDPIDFGSENQFFTGINFCTIDYVRMPRVWMPWHVKNDLIPRSFYRYHSCSTEFLLWWIYFSIRFQSGIYEGFNRIEVYGTVLATSPIWFHADGTLNPSCLWECHVHVVGISSNSSVFTALDFDNISEVHFKLFSHCIEDAWIFSDSY